MTVLGPLSLAAALLLVASGLAKLRFPAPASAVLTALRVPGWRTLPQQALVRVGALVEVAIGAAAVLLGDTVSFTVLGVCYLVFAAVTVRLLALGSRAACGCFGRADTPVGAAHLVVVLTCLSVAGAAAAAPPGSVGAVVAGTPAHTLTLGAQVVLLAWLGYLAMTALPALTAARRALGEAR